MTSPVNVVHILRNARQDAQRNAVVLDNISTPKKNGLRRHRMPSQPNAEPQPIKTSSSEKKDASRGGPASPVEKELPSRGAEAAASKDDTKPEGHGDNLPTSKPKHTSSKQSSPHPISKYILSSLFTAVDRLAAKSEDEESHNYLFLDNGKENNFLYGLVVPLIARLLAVSCPGVLCIVQLPRQPRHVEWSSPTHCNYGSYGSNGSKSLSHTTPSPQDTSRTASPSDEELGGVERKSFSPDSNPGTAELIRHADKILSGAEAAAEGRAAAAGLRKESSPPPSNSVHDHGTLRLICNGFEVLTGKMPSPKDSMGPFTMASVGWEKAGVVSPSTPSKGVTMSFSNGMMVPTKGIVVTFSNGSMCFLTLEDPLLAAESLRISLATPVVVFSFLHPGDVPRGSILQNDPTTPHPEAERIRAMLDRKNVFVVEIGDANNNSSSDVSGSLDASESTQSDAVQIMSFGHGEVLESKELDPKESAYLCSPHKCPPVVIGAVPRAIPLFVNTINQTFIDGPFYEVPENSYGNALPDDRFRDITHSSHLRRSSRGRIISRESKRVRHPNGKVPFSAPGHATCNNGVVQTAVQYDSASDGAHVEGLSHENSLKQSESVLQPNGTIESSHLHASSSPAVSQAHTSAGPPTSLNQETAAFQGRPMYEYYPYGPIPSFPPGYLPGHGGHDSRNMAGPGAVRHQGHAPVNGADPRYFHAAAPPPSGPIGHGQYHHQPYYSVPPPSMVHGVSQNGRPWHERMPTLSHPPAPLPSPHPMDARRDMPVHFSSHRAVASAHGHYNSQHFQGPPHLSQGYDGRHNHTVHGPGVAAYQDPKLSGNYSPASAGMAGMAGIPVRDSPMGEGYNTVADVYASGKKQLARTHGGAPRTSTAAPPQHLQSVVTTKLPLGSVPSEHEHLSKDKESALRALMEMQSGVHGEARAQQARSETATEGHHDGGVESRTPGKEKDWRNTSWQAPHANAEIRPAATASCSPQDGSFITRNRSHVSTGTNSGTSTNSHSQGKALTQGAMIGNSPHSNHQSRIASQRKIKRQRLE